MDRTERYNRIVQLTRKRSRNEPIKTLSIPLRIAWEFGYEYIDGLELTQEADGSNRLYYSDSQWYYYENNDTNEIPIQIDPNIIEQSTPGRQLMYNTIEFNVPEFMHWLYNRIPEYAAMILSNACTDIIIDDTIMFLADDIQMIGKMYGLSEISTDQGDIKKLISEYDDKKIINDFTAIYKVFEMPDTALGYRGLLGRHIQLARVASNSYNVAVPLIYNKKIEIEPWNGDLIEIVIGYTAKPISITFSSTTSPSEFHNILELPDTEYIEWQNTDTIIVSNQRWYKYILNIFRPTREQAIYYPDLQFVLETPRLDDFPELIRIDKNAIDCVENRDQYTKWISKQTTIQQTWLNQLYSQARICRTKLALYSDSNGDSHVVYGLECYNKEELYRYVLNGMAFLEQEQILGEILKQHNKDILSMYGTELNYTNESWWLNHTDGRLKWFDTINGDLFGANTGLKSALENIYNQHSGQYYNGVTAEMKKSNERNQKWLGLGNQILLYLQNISKWQPYITDIRIYAKNINLYDYTYTINRDPGSLVMSAFDYTKITTTELESIKIAEYKKYELN